jgi:hypothetical protein
MSINVIVHQPSAEGLEEVLNYGEQRRDFTRMIGRAIGSSIPGITDSVTLYAVGKEANEAKKDFVVVSNNGDQQDELDEIEDITRSGLTFIVSDFLKLDPGLIRANNKIIAVKANIPEDLELKARPLVIRSGVNGGEIDLSNPSDLERVNRALIVNDLRIQNALRVSGIAVASVVQDRQSNYGINRQLADRAIANSVKETRLKIKH